MGFSWTTLARSKASGQHVYQSRPPDSGVVGLNMMQCCCCENQQELVEGQIDGLRAGRTSRLPSE
jgi:hypothetical protein